MPTVTVTIYGLPRSFDRHLLLVAVAARRDWPHDTGPVFDTLERHGITGHDALRLVVGAHHCLRNHIEP